MKTLKIDNSHNLESKISDIKETFKKEGYLEYILDLSALNLIDAAKTALLISTGLLIQNPQTKVNCILKDRETLNIIKAQKLKNTFLSVNLDEEKNFELRNKKKVCK